MLTRYDLTTGELMVLNSELQHAEKSMALAYLMLLGGHLGVHRFYLKRIGTAVLQLILFIIATISYFVFAVTIEFSEAVGILSFIAMLLTGLPLFIWIIVDLFRMPRMVREWNEQVERQIIEEIVRYRPIG